MTSREYADESDGDIEVDLSDYEGDGGGGAGAPGKKERKKRAVKAVKDYLKTHKQDKTYSRVLKAHKAHPGASLYELQHGMKSKAAQAYRARQASPFAGRVDHAAIHRAFKESGYTVLKDGDYAPGPITATHGNKVVLYGGLFVYNPQKDKGRRYDKITEDLLCQVQMNLRKEKK